MAKRNDKGFSLVEIMIAIAIFTVLLTPIMQQFAQTLLTSRKAKEQQQANENAAYVLEYFQKNNARDITDLQAITDPNGAFATGVPTARLVDAATPNPIICEIYDTTGGFAGATVQYNAYKYDLDDVKLGTRRTNYQRSVVLDDLSTRLMAADATNGVGYKINYSMTSADLANFPSGFKLTNEGSIVQYDSDGYVVAVACNTAAYVQDPNDVNLGNMQDLDKRKVAIIDATAAAFDAQAEIKFYALAMDRLREIDEASWQQALLHSSNDSILQQQDYADAVTKLTRIYVEEFTDAEGPYYQVKVDIYYENKYSLNDFDGYNHNFEDTLTYNVLSQRFDTEKCPDVYFEYQPYERDRVGSSVMYTANDYILIDNYVEGAKLYLYQPYLDAMSAVAGASGTGNSSGEYTTTVGGTTKVKIHVCDTNANTKPMQIFTNLTDIPGQFDVLQYSNISTITTASDTPGNSSLNMRKDFSGTVKGLESDIRTQARLFTVTVTLEPDDSGSNTVTLTGAKGE